MIDCSIFQVSIVLVVVFFSGGCVDRLEVAGPGELQVDRGGPEGIVRYGNSQYLRSKMIEPLRETVRLPEEFADDLYELRRRALSFPDYTGDVSTEGFTVRYFAGQNHSHHGLVQHGVGELASRPESGDYFAEYCFDEDGRLIKVIANPNSGVRYVSRFFVYEANQPSAMLTFGPEGFNFGDYGLYREGRLCLVARINKDGDLVFCECIFYLRDFEDYSVRYVARRGKEDFSLSDLSLESIDLNGRSILRFGKFGELKHIYHYDLPREALK